MVAVLEYCWGKTIIILREICLFPSVLVENFKEENLFTVCYMFPYWASSVVLI